MQEGESLNPHQGILFLLLLLTFLIAQFFSTNGNLVGIHTGFFVWGRKDM